MRTDVIFFLFALSFLSGILFENLGLSLIFSIVPAAILFATLFAGNVRVTLTITAAALLVAGCAYAQWYSGSHPPTKTTPPQNAIKGVIENAYGNYFAPEKAALLSAIVFGDNAGVSRSTANALQQSGLRFITAIDGLHMQIIIVIIASCLFYLLPRRYALVLTFVFVLAFIALTGFTISGIRASLMAGIATLATEGRRVYLAHNALAFTALVIAIINPLALTSDIGFQLSFLAVISIIYMKPALQALLHLGEGPGILAWKESLLITLSVQLGTAPIIIQQFQTFSLTSFVASVLVVWILQYILFLGLVIPLVSFIFPLLALALSHIASPLLAYIDLIARLFARFAVLFNPTLGFAGIALYYGCMVIFLYWFYRLPRVVLTEAAPAPMPSQERSELEKLAGEFEIVEI